ncbi:hypothetical protein HanIR_Chr07g0320361 [Helianthus annuus]|nr:hypothetical protein HanIR_Chr07g0320361 [Helianthus annuus]
MDNEFYNAFASPITMTQNALIENETGTSQKPPKLMDIDDYCHTLTFTEACVCDLISFHCIRL